MNVPHQKNLQEQLQSEGRVCGECGYQVANPFYERCPRCNTLLPLLDLYCSGCIHNSVCPALAEKEKINTAATGRRPDQETSS